MKIRYSDRHVVYSLEIDMNPKTTNATMTPNDITPRKVSSHELLQGENKIIISHAGTQYILQTTRSKKLILTK